MPDVIRDLLSIRSMALFIFVRSGLMPMPGSSVSLFLLDRIEATSHLAPQELDNYACLIPALPFSVTHTERLEMAGSILAKTFAGELRSY